MSETGRALPDPPGAPPGPAGPALAVPPGPAGPALAALRFRYVALTFIAILALGVVLLFTLFFVVDVASGARGRPFGLSEMMLVGGYVAQNAAIVAGVYGVLIAWRKLSWDALGLRPAPRRWIVFAVAIAAVAVPATMALEVLLEALFAISYDTLARELYAPFGFTWTSAIGMAVAAVIIAPICEEILFRGVLYGWLRGRWPAAAALPVSAAVFATAHILPPLMVETFLIGLVLSWLYERTGSLLPAIVMHMAFNGIVLTHLFATLAAEA